MKLIKLPNSRDRYCVCNEFHNTQIADCKGSAKIRLFTDALCRHSFCILALSNRFQRGL